MFFFFFIVLLPFSFFFFFFFNDTATTEIYTLSLHDALPICSFLPGPQESGRGSRVRTSLCALDSVVDSATPPHGNRSEEHTSELQSLAYLVCRLLLEKKKNTQQLQSPFLQRHPVHRSQHIPS